MRRFMGLIVFLTLLVNSAGTGSYAQSPASSLKLPPFKKVKLNNGLTVLLMEQHEVPLVSFNVIIKAGAAADPKGKEGAAAATAELLRKGTKSRSADQISAELDFIGGLLNENVNFDYTNIAAEFTKKDLDKGLNLLSEILLSSTLPESEVTKLVKQRIDEVTASRDQAQSIIGLYFNRYLFGDHVYGRPINGDERSLAAIKRDDIVKLYETYYTPGNTIIAAVGDFSTATMEQLLAGKFGAWPNRQTPALSIPEVPRFTGKKLLLIDKPDSTQTFYRIGNIGLARNNVDRTYINVVNTLFGGRFTSMLNSALRINSGLTYGAGSAFDLRKLPGPFFISSFTRNETTEKAIDLTLEVLKQLHEKGISEEELKSAKSYIKGQFPPGIETSDRLAALLASLEFFGLDKGEVDELYQKVDSMTVADARRIIKQYFPLDNLVFVLVGKSGDISGVAKKYAQQIETKSVSEPGF